MPTTNRSVLILHANHAYYTPTNLYPYYIAYVANEFVTYSPARSSPTCLSFVRSNALHPPRSFTCCCQGPSPAPLLRDHHPTSPRARNSLPDDPLPTVKLHPAKLHPVKLHPAKRSKYKPDVTRRSSTQQERTTSLRAPLAVPQDRWELESSTLGISSNNVLQNQAM